MQELIKLRTFIENEIEKATPVVSNWGCDCEFCNECKNTITQSAFSLVIKQLDLILNNSVVKPSERRSPTDETFSGCKPPDERQNPLEEKSESNENIDDRNKIPFYKLCPECSATF